MKEPVNRLLLQLPAWAEARIAHDLLYPTHSEKMDFVLDLLDAHIKHRTGYPFTAAIFNSEHKVIAVGVNNSILLNNSTAHAEMLAVQFSQAYLEKPYLPKGRGYTLVASAQPCAMCSAAIYSSGIRELIVGASASDVEEIMGFGLGPLHSDWREFFAAKKINVVEGVDRERAKALLLEYQALTAGSLSADNKGLRPGTPPDAPLI